MSTLRKEDVVFVVVDFQEKLLPAMKDPAELESTVVKLAKGMKTLNIQTIVTQQYTKGLGPTTRPIAEALGEFEPIDKTSFSAMSEPAFVKALEDSDKNIIILCGIEAHICVQQTAEDLLEQGYQVYVIEDCIASRKESDFHCSRRRMASAGAIVTTYEAVLYKLLGGAKAEGFKDISAIVK